MNGAPRSQSGSRRPRCEIQAVATASSMPGTKSPMRNGSQVPSWAKVESWTSMRISTRFASVDATSSTTSETTSTRSCSRSVRGRRESSHAQHGTNT